jgi:hypothetical protein
MRSNFTFRGVSLIRSMWACFFMLSVFLPATCYAEEAENLKPAIYSSDANADKISVALLRLRKDVSDTSATISVEAAGTGMRIENDAVVVDIITTPTQLTDDQMSQFALADTELQDYFPRYYQIVAYVSNLDDLITLAKIPEVMMIRPQYLPRTMAGTVDSHASTALRADAVRNLYGLDGFGQRVGILSDSIAQTSSVRDSDTEPGQGFSGSMHSSIQQDSGDLPGDINIVRDDYAAGEDEGAAMGELVSDMAPGAALAFHTSHGGEGVMAEGIRRLYFSNATLMVDDTRYPNEPAYQDGVIALEANNAISAGVPLISAAGNDGDLGFVQRYKDVNATVQEKTIPPDGDDLHDWGGGNAFLPITIPAGENLQLMLQWNQPFQSLAPFGGGSQIDLDLYLCEDPTIESLQQTPYKGADAQGDTDAPQGDAFELQYLTYENTSGSPKTVYLAVDNFRGRNILIPQGDDVPIEFRVIFWQHGDGITSPISGPSLFGHPSKGSIISVGAVPWWLIPHCDSGSPDLPSAPESFTSKGGFISQMFSTDGGFHFTGAFAPTLASADGTNTTFIGENDLTVPPQDGEPDGNPNYFGTSAAAANFAGAMALVKQANSFRNVAQVRYTMISNACDVDQSPAAPGRDDRTGAGVTDTKAAVDSVRRGINLALFRPGTWSDRVVISQDMNATEDGETFNSGEDIYANFAAVNTGTFTSRNSGTAVVTVDGRRIRARVSLGPMPPGLPETVRTNINIGSLDPGTHTIRLTLDGFRHVFETDKQDNWLQKTITVE